MALLTYTDARNALRFSTGRADAMAARSVVAAAGQARQSDAFDVFLSHCGLDQDLLAGVVSYLELAGLIVYLDSVNDPMLRPEAVSVATASTLRTRMGQCRNLYYAATPNASGSKWMPWELGYFDGMRPGGVFVLPVVPSATVGFVGQEYLGLYPLVDKGVIEQSRAHLEVHVPGSGARREAVAYARRTTI